MIRAQVKEIVEKAKQYNATLVCVTKTVGIDRTNELIDEGFLDIAENRAQVLRDKLPFIDSRARIHFIGPLQKNKIKYLKDRVYLIHSVDSVDLANEIDAHAKKLGYTQNILLQVNIAGETQKQGFAKEELEEAFLKIKELKNLNIMGLMMIAPLTDDKEELTRYFKDTQYIFDYYKNKYYNELDMQYLSMGMSNDYEIALSCGSNMIRIGRKIVGGTSECYV